MITATGLGSGLDIESLVSQLVAAERQGPEQRLDRKEAQIQAELSAFGLLRSATSAFQAAASSLDSASLWDSLSANSSDDSVLGISVGNGASPADYSVEVSQLARSQALASMAFADSDTTELGSGTLTIRFGTTDYTSGTDTYNSFTPNAERASVSFDIQSPNNTLQGIADTINEAEEGITATIVNDGSGFRLLLSSEFTGEANSLEIVATDDDGNSTDAAGLSRFTFSAASTQLEQTVAAADANLTINGLSITSDSNTLDETLQGVNLNLQKITDGPVQLSIDRDLATMQAGVKRLVDEYNALRGTISSLAGYNAETQEGGILNGDFTTRAVSDRISAVLRSAIGGTAELQTLSQIGISTQTDGTLALDESVLSEALQDNLQEVRALFTASGKPSESSINYLGASADTASGDYAINITQLATSGQLTGAGSLPNFGGGGSVTIDDNNDEFSIDVDGLGSVAITLTQGSYTDGATLAADIQEAINSNSQLSSQGSLVTVSYNGTSNALEISSDSLGSASSIEITAVDVNTSSSLGLAVAIGTSGLDVAGTIGGQFASGEGNILTGGPGTQAEGLRLLIGTGALGPRGNVNFSRGLADQLDNLLDDYLASDGLLENRTSGLQSRVDTINDEREALDRRLEAIETRYRSQFASLDILLGQLQSTSTFLAQQLANLPEPNSINDNQ